MPERFIARPFAAAGVHLEAGAEAEHGFHAAAEFLLPRDGDVAALDRADLADAVEALEHAEIEQAVDGHCGLRPRRRIECYA